MNTHDFTIKLNHIANRLMEFDNDVEAFPSPFRNKMEEITLAMKRDLERMRGVILDYELELKEQGAANG